MNDNPIAMLTIVATVLDRLPQSIVYTGGATIPLYLDSVSARDIRPTDDVDCVVEVTSQREYYRLAEMLRELGLNEDSSAGAPLCRWLCQGIKLDVMPIDPAILGFGNPWYKRGTATAVEFALPSNLRINIFAPAYLMASKISAFQSRGRNQFYFSKDFEDIIALLNGCLNLVSEISVSDREVRSFIVNWIKSERINLETIAPAFLGDTDRLSGRDKLLITTIDRLALL